MFGNDPRVTSFWGGLAFIYDAYFAYGKDAIWKDGGGPISLVVDGSEIISHVDGLQQEFVPLLGVT